MSLIPKQYSNFLNKPENLQGGLSPLQLAAIYYMIEGKQIPFFINHAWLKALNVYCNSGILDPKQVGATGPVVVKEDKIYSIETAPDCGPDEKNRTEEMYRGEISSLNVPVWRAGTNTVIRGGSAANGVGGPWGTGGIVSPSPNPGNSTDLPDPVVSNVEAAYAIDPSLENIVYESLVDPVGFAANVTGNNYPINYQGIA